MSQKPNKTHKKKKADAPSTPTPSEGILPLENTSTALIFGPANVEMVRAEVIEKITGIGDAKLRALGYDGVIAKPVRARWPLQDTLTRLFAHLRSRADKPAELPIYDSMDACAGAGMFSKKFLQRLKESGCPGFENTRVNLTKLIPAIEPWLIGQDAADKERLARQGVTSWGEYGEKFKALNEEEEYKKTIEQTIDKGVSVGVAQEMSGIYFAHLDRTVSEYPTALTGRSKKEILDTLLRDTKETRKKIEHAITAHAAKQSTAPAATT